ncbi:MAG: portal protein [Steroidobacteraceae bacterium]
MSLDVDTILRHEAYLAERRANFESWWQDIAYRVMPSEAQFTTLGPEGERRTERLFDANAAICNERFASVMEDLLTPRTQYWHQLRPLDKALAENQNVKVYLEEVNQALFTLRYRPSANFASQKHQGYLSLGAFGNSCLFIDELAGVGPRYRQVPLREVRWSENHQGLIDTLYRRFPMQARQALQRFGDRLPQKIRDDAEKNPYREWEFIHCVRPNEDRVSGRDDHRGMRWASYYVACEARQMLEVSGYSSWPYAIGRYMLASRETYARSPAMTAWSAIMTINEEKKTILRAGQKEVDPPVLLQEEGVLESFNLRPGALNYGAVSNDGSPLAVPFKSGANVPLGLELMELEKQQIEDSFLVTVFKVLAENPQMTATQVLEVAQQKGILLAPAMGRQHSEDLGPLIEREIDIAARNGLLPQMPDELAEAGGAYKIE